MMTKDETIVDSVDNQHEVNPIWEESSRNLSTSPEDDSEKYDDQNCQHETPSWNRKSYSADNIYRPPRSRSRSTSYLEEHWKTNSSNDDETQSIGYSNG